MALIFAFPPTGGLLADALQHLVPGPTDAAAQAQPTRTVRLPVLAYSALDEVDAETFFDDWGQLNHEIWRSGILVYWPDAITLPWDYGNHLGAIERSACEHLVHLVASPEGFATFVENAPSAPPSWAIMEILEVFEARGLFSALRGFSHGGRHDITNQILGPARLLLMAAASDSNAKAIFSGWLASRDGMSWRRFLNEFIQPLASRLAAASESESACRRLSDSFVTQAATLPEDLGQWGPRHLLAIEALLITLTACRTRAGAKTDDNPAASLPTVISADEPLNIGDSKAPSRILVVDDHAREWRAVLQIVHSALEKRLGETVRIDVSLDGQHLLSGNGRVAPLLGSIADYDVVLLDIYMGEIRGLTLLRQIRSAFLYLPVVIWTTSRDIDLPASANLANGFLFKKTTNVGEIVDTLGPWLENGRSARAATLPNRFFDHTIRTLKHRLAIKSLTNWALQLLDTFPALNASYFRNFTDHGGRHFVQLMEYMEQIVRPLLLAGGFFSESAARREEEVTALYLALTCHEFGMFPVFLREESFDDLTLDQNEAVRKLHAVRGLQFLARKDNWAEDFDSASDGVLSQENFLGVAVPLIVGYHSRLLPLGDFGSIPAKVAEKIDALQCQTAREHPRLLVLPTAAELRDTLRRLIGSHQLDCRRQVVRRLCSIVRFVDAIDVERSRLPSQFLRSSARPPVTPEEASARASTLCEYLKRQLLAKVRVDRGEVSLNLLCPLPSESICDGVNACLVGENLTLAMLQSPWDDLHREQVRGLRERIDRFLAGIFRDRQAIPGSNFFNRATVLATLSALSVASEILEEYQAIAECSLAHVIRLGQFEWGSNDGWRPEETELKLLRTEDLAALNIEYGGRSDGDGLPGNPSRVGPLL